MKNIYGNKAVNETVDSLAEKTIILKRKIHPALFKIIKLANKKEIIIYDYPNLNNDESYIFAAGHSFPEEIAANLSVIKNHTYVLIGTTDQVLNYPAMAILWLNGMIYVNKLDKESRHDAFLRMKKVLENGSSILMFPEGVLNNSENLLCNNVYPGFYHLAVETGKKVVPIVSYTLNDSKKIHTKLGEPVDISSFSKKEAMIWLRDQIATLRYEMMGKEPMLMRDELTGDIHQKFMEYRRDTYREVKWTKDVWDEEIMFYKEKDYVTPEESLEYVDNLIITPQNASIVAPVLVRRLEQKKYNFKNYMHENWNK